MALLHLSDPVRGHAFEWSAESPEVGDDIAALGYPLGQPLAMTRGAITAVARRIEVGGQDLRQLIQTDAAINPGNSSGPLIGLDGRVIGVVTAGSDAAGDAYAIDPQVAQDAGPGWMSNPEPVNGQCVTDDERDRPDVRPPPLDVTVTSQHPEAASLALTFQLYADAINATYRQPQHSRRVSEPG